MGHNRGITSVIKNYFLRSYVKLLAFSNFFYCIPQHSSANGVSLCCGLISAWALTILEEHFQKFFELSKSKVNHI